MTIYTRLLFYQVTWGCIWCKFCCPLPPISEIANCHGLSLHATVGLHHAVFQLKHVIHDWQSCKKWYDQRANDSATDVWPPPASQWVKNKFRNAKSDHFRDSHSGKRRLPVACVSRLCDRCCRPSEADVQRSEFRSLCNIRILITSVFNLSGSFLFYLLIEALSLSVCVPPYLCLLNECAKLLQGFT